MKESNKHWWSDPIFWGWQAVGYLILGGILFIWQKETMALFVLCLSFGVSGTVLVWEGKIALQDKKLEVGMPFSKIYTGAKAEKVGYLCMLAGILVWGYMMYLFSLL